MLPLIPSNSYLVKYIRASNAETIGGEAEVVPVKVGGDVGEPE